jgi:hypothetical protein
LFAHEKRTSRLTSTAGTDCQTRSEINRKHDGATAVYVGGNSAHDITRRARASPRRVVQYVQERAYLQDSSTDHVVPGYILRMKQSVDNQAQPANTSSARRAPARPVYNDNHSSYGSYNHSAPGPQRGSSDRGRGGAYAYHPYQRPTPKFRNKTVIFNNADSSSDTLEDGQTTVPVTSNTRPGQGNMQQTETEAQPLCRTFTLTGTQETDNPAIISR